MWSITLKLMKKSTRMLIPAGIAILIGTAFIASTFLFANTLDDSMRSQLTAQFGQANYIAAPDSQDNTYGAKVSDFKPEQMTAISGVNDMRADASIELQANNGDTHASILAISTSKDAKLLPVTVVEGTQPRGDDEVALTRSSATQLKLAIGDTFTVSRSASMSQGGGQSQVQRVRLTGLTDDPNHAYSYYGGAAIASDNLLALGYGASTFNDVPSYMAYFDIDEAQADAVLTQVNKLLPDGFSFSTRQKAGDDALKTLSGSQTSIITTFLMVFGVLAMFVAALVIANTFQVLVAQRRRTLALLRTIGAKKGQLYRSVILEACMLGFVASLLGVGLGVGLMGIVCNSGVLINMGLNARLILSWQVFAIPLAFGIVMTVLASLGSARSATSVTPLEALRPIELTDTRRSGVVRAVLGSLMILAGVALTAFGVWRVWSELQNGGLESGNDYTSLLLMAIAGCALVFLGLVLTATFWLPVLMKGVGAVVSTAGPSAKIAHANIQKNPRRIGATGVALLIGVTLVTCIATGAASGKQTINTALDTRYSVDVTAQGTQLSKQAADKVAQAKGVEHTVYAPVAVADATDGKGTTLSTLLVGVSGTKDLGQVMHTSLDGISIDDNTALVPKYDAMKGSELTFNGGKASFAPGSTDESSGESGASGTSGGWNTLTLSTQQADYRRVSSNYQMVAFINIDHFTNGDVKENGHVLLAKLDTKDATLAEIFENVQSILGTDSGVSVTGPVAERLTWENVINTMLALLVGLLGIAVLIALIGVANTLSLSVIERTRESATLRAIGMTKGQLRRSLAVEALLISVVSGVVGILLGTAFGWVGSYMVFSTYGTVVLPFEWATNGLVLVIAALAALLASVFPARRAVKTPPVRALAEA